VTYPLLTIQQVAERLNVSRWSAYRLVREGALRPVRLSPKRLRFTPEAVEEAVRLAERPQPAQPPAAVTAG
jgi:excisionase family DNA binding protein